MNLYLTRSFLWWLGVLALLASVSYWVAPLFVVVPPLAMLLGGALLADILLLWRLGSMRARRGVADRLWNGNVQGVHAACDLLF